MESEDPKLNLKNALDNWAGINKKNAEMGFTEGLFTGALVSSSIIDKFSTWLLAGTGATAALMIANLDKLSPVLGSETFRQAIYLLVVSALLGFLAKYKSIHCQIMLATGEEIKKRVLPVLEKHGEDEKKIEGMAKEHDIEVNTEMDLEYVFKEYCRAFPKVMHHWLLRQFTQGLNDRLAPSRKAANGLFWQGNYTVLQFFTFLGFVLVSVQKINGI
ncbi:MAG: hypothetical protein ACQETL_19400 [Bacteroidota bacterium]